MSGASLGGLDPAGWKCDEDSEMKNGEPQCKDEEECAPFVHSQSLEKGDVWRMKVVEGEYASVGIAAEGYDVERGNEMGNRIAGVALHDGTTFILSAISQDGEQHYNEDHLKDLIPKTLPYDVALPTHQ